MLLGLRTREPRRITTGRAPQRRESLDKSQQGAGEHTLQTIAGEAFGDHLRHFPKYLQGFLMMRSIHGENQVIVNSDAFMEPNLLAHSVCRRRFLVIIPSDA